MAFELRHVISTMWHLPGRVAQLVNVSGYRCMSDCRSRGHEFDPGPVPYFCGDRLWNYFYCHSPPFRLFIQEGLLSVTSKSMCMNYWLTACSSLPRKSVVRWTDRPAMTIAVDLGRKARKQTKQCGISTSVASDEHVQSPLKLKNSKYLHSQCSCCWNHHFWLLSFLHAKYLNVMWSRPHIQAE